MNADALALVRNTDDLATLIAPAQSRVDYVVYVMRDCQGISVRAINRAFSLASKVLRTDYETTKRIFHMAWFGGSERFMDMIGPLDPDAVGAVYYAQCDTMPGLIKVGFTTDLLRRRDQLSKIHGSPVRILSAHVGTMLEEHASHCLHRKDRVVGEWFREEAFYGFALPYPEGVAAKAADTASLLPVSAATSIGAA